MKRPHSIDIDQIIAKEGKAGFLINLNLEIEKAETQEGFLIQNGLVIILCKAKSGSLVIDSKEYKLSDQHIILLPENHIINRLDSIKSDNIQMIAVSTDYILGMPSPIDTNIFAYSRHISVIRISEEKFEDLMHYYTFLHRESKEESPYQTEIIHSIFYALILEILGEYKKLLISGPQSTIKAEQLSDRFFQLLATHYREQRSVQFYADKLNLTPKYLSSAIKRITGRPILDWIHEAILIDAKMMLRASNLNVQQISEQLNFSSPSAFVQFIRKHTGKTPKQIMKIDLT